MRALVIGASGFIGLHVVDRLIEQGVEVRVTVRKSTSTIFLRKRRLTCVPGSLEQPELLTEAMRGCDAVFLTGAYYPRYSADLQECVARGVEGVRNACEAALQAGVPRLIYTGSIAALGTSARALADEDDIGPLPPGDSVYRATKWAMQRELDAARARGLHVVDLLVGGCIGPGDFRLGTSGLLVLAVRGELPFWVDGTVNLVAVEDVAEAHLAALHAKSERYCIAPHNVRFGELLQGIVERYGGRIPERLDPSEAARLADQLERDAQPRKARVPFPRELVDIISSGQPVSSARAERELDLKFSPLWPAFDRAHAFFTRYGFIPRSQQRERESA